MSDIEQLREKYKNRDIIEITGKTQVKIIEWLTGTISMGEVDIRKVCGKLSENGFIKFLNRGVILIKHETAFKHTSVYPFEFNDAGTLTQSIYVNNPITDELELLCKVCSGTDTMYKVIDGTYNSDLAALHIKHEWDCDRVNISQLTPIIQHVGKENPDIKPGTNEWNRAVSESYFTHIIKAQILSIIGINAYFTLLEKDLLISKIEQKREYKASTGNNNTRRKTTPYYRYLVQIPANYTPRKFELNYILSDWQRSGHMTTKWVRPENAEALAKRRGGVLTSISKGKYVAIKIPLAPQTVKRRIKKIADNSGVKSYE